MPLRGKTRDDNSPMTETFSGASPLPHWGVIRARGSDAAPFIHSQLSQDFALLGPDQARLAAFCNAKGRMQASFIGIKPDAHTVLLVCQRDVLAQTLKRLRMFVLRAQCQLDDASDAFALWGLVGSAVPAPCTSPWQVQHEGSTHTIGLYPGADHPRALWLAPAGATPAAAPLPSATWQWLDVMSAVPLVGAALYEQFVPQMLNYESVGGVSFKKGCYPGQEIVARSQFRGTLKRRAYLAQAAGAIAPGVEVFAINDADQPAGVVVASAPNPTQPDQWSAVIAMQISAAGQDLQANGVALRLLPLPYPLLEDI